MSAHPLSERLYGQLMRALHAGGRPAEALTVFEDARRTLADELGADPSPELSALHLELLQGGERERHRLPVQLTRFVGRESELARIAALLADARLVTLTGPAARARHGWRSRRRAGTPVSVSWSSPRSPTAPRSRTPS